jgi:hypothetical protein
LVDELRFVAFLDIGTVQIERWLQEVFVTSACSVVAMQLAGDHPILTSLRQHRIRVRKLIESETSCNQSSLFVVQL